MLVYTVKRGDTLWQIAKEYQISLDALLAANPHISDPNYILPGSRINVPRLAAMPEPLQPEKSWMQDELRRDTETQEREAMMQQEVIRQQEAMIQQEENLIRREEMMRHEEELMRHEEMLRREEMIQREEELRREEAVRQEEELMRHEEELRREELLRREEMLRREEEMRREEAMHQNQHNHMEEPAHECQCMRQHTHQEEINCAMGGARPCIYITSGGETLHSISEEWGVPIAQLHYHNYRYTQAAQLPGGERIIIPLAHDYHIQVNNHSPNRGLRGRRRR